ncbi:hypothetical protein COE30_22305 [Bacillus cereus]|nr:hypothetical protein COE30_22305 [Bacillus cereus]
MNYKEVRNRAKNFKYACAEATDRHNRILSELLNLQMRWIGASSLACYYPIGNISTEYNMFFNHEHISEVIFTGYVNEDEMKLREDLK